MTDGLTQFILKPTGPLAAGVVLFGGVWGFFKGVESVLNEDTKIEIWVWLSGRKKLSPTFQSWPDTFAKMFDRVFGHKHISLKCFRRSSLISITLYCLVFCIGLIQGSSIVRLPAWTEHGAEYEATIQPAQDISLFPMLPIFLFVVVFGDYLSLLETRLLLGLGKRKGSIGIIVLCLVMACLVTYCIGILIVRLNWWWTMAYIQAYWWSDGFWAVFWALLWNFPGAVIAWFRLHSTLDFVRLPTGRLAFLWFYPAFFTSIWLWLYARSGFILKAARRFDIGFDWFNRKFDIEKKPLSSIGLVAGALVAVVYWLALIVAKGVG
jgi:hypothetical protein